MAYPVAFWGSAGSETACTVDETITVLKRVDLLTVNESLSINKINLCRNITVFILVLLIKKSLSYKKQTVQ